MSQKHIRAENCMQTPTARHIHQDRLWPVDAEMDAPAVAPQIPVGIPR